MMVMRLLTGLAYRIDGRDKLDTAEDIRRRTFFAVHRDLPREAPGNRASTLQALEIALGAAPGRPASVLDVGSGPGAQTLDLAAELPAARLLAVDLHGPFLRDLATRSARAGCAGRVTAVCADMQRLPVADAAVDLLWCEGAAYLMGVAEALEAWRPLLRPHGVCAFTEAVWLRDHPPEPVRACWAEYPGMGTVAACRQLIRARGYELAGDFVLPPEAWWDDYYRPMSARLADLEPRFRGQPEAMAVIEACRDEIDCYRRFSDWYGYAFFVASKA